MNRITKAWKALRGTLEPEVREVSVPILGDAHMAKLYLVDVPDTTSRSIKASNGAIYYTASNPAYYTTCEQAHTEHPGKLVEEVKAVRVGAAYFVGNLRAVKAEPKPKRPKGRA